MSIITVVTESLGSIVLGKDWTRIKKAKASLLQLLNDKRIKGQPGAGVDIPVDPRTGEPDAYWQKAVEQLCKESNGRITVARFRGRPQVCWRVDAEAGLSDEMRKTLFANKFFSVPGDPVSGLDPEHVGRPKDVKEEW